MTSVVKPFASVASFVVASLVSRETASVAEPFSMDAPRTAMDAATATAEAATHMATTAEAAPAAHMATTEAAAMAAAAPAKTAAAEAAAVAASTSTSATVRETISGGETREESGSHSRRDHRLA